eukprot:5032811-Pyramimonas_sp.AAC.1
MSVVVYSGEVTPGDNLEGHNSRKLMSFYWSWAELGVGNLSNELLWATVVGVRCDTVDELPGGNAE